MCNIGRPEPVLELPPGEDSGQKGWQAAETHHLSVLASTMDTGRIAELISMRHAEAGATIFEGDGYQKATAETPQPMHECIGDKHRPQLTNRLRLGTQST